MKRTKLIDRILPNYTKGEEIFNMVTHIVGGGLYRVGVNKKYMHSLFHIFVDLASVAQFVGIVFYVL